MRSLDDDRSLQVRLPKDEGNILNAHLSPSQQQFLLSRHSFCQPFSAIDRPSHLPALLRDLRLWFLISLRPTGPIDARDHLRSSGKHTRCSKRSAGSVQSCFIPETSGTQSPSLLLAVSDSTVPLSQWIQHRTCFDFHQDNNTLVRPLRS